MIIDSPIISGSYLSTGSLSQTGNVSITGSLTATAGITGSFSGSGANLFDIPAAGIVGLNLSQIASGSASASIAPNTGFVVNTNTKISGSTQITGSLGVTGSFSVSGSTGTVFSSNADILLISGSLVVTGSTIITGSLSVSGSITGSLFGTSSQAVSSSYANFALTSSYSLAGSGFPYSGSAVITGSLVITNLETGSGVRYLVADASGLIQAQTASAVIFTTQQTIATAGQTVFPITNGYSTGYVTVFVNGSKLNDDEFTDTSGTNIVFATGSMVNDVVEFQKYLPASGVSNNTLRTQNYFVATSGQTTFNVNYTPGLVDLFYNGSKLENTEYTAANGTSITLATASAVGDKLEVDVYSYQIGAFSGIGGSGVARELAFYNTTNSITGSNKVTYDGATFSVTGSFLVTGSSTFTNIGPAVFSGSVTAVGGFSGSFSGNADSASLAQNSLLLQGTGSVGFTTTASFLAVSSSQQQISASQQQLSSSFLALTASFNAVSASQQQISASLLNVISIFATTGSNSFRATQSITGSLTVTGQIIAQSINVQQVTSSIVYSSGSNVFGCDLNSRQTFTGSFYQTGSVAIFNSSISIGSSCNPTYALDVYNRTGNVAMRLFQPSALSSDYNSMYFTGNHTCVTGYIGSAGSTTPNASLQNSFYMGVQNAYPLKFATSDTVRATITSAGITCFSCQICAPLIRVQTAGGEAEAIRHSNATVNNWSIGTDASCNAFFQTFEAAKCLILSTGGSGAARLTINGSGNVGIGCTMPNRALTVNGCIGMPTSYNWGVINDNDANWGFKVCAACGNYSTFVSYASDAGSDRRGGIYNSNGHWVAYGNNLGHFVVQCNLYTSGVTCITKIGYNGYNGATGYDLLGHFDAGSTNIATLSGENAYTRVVAHIEWVSNYALAGTNMTMGYTIVDTRRGNSNTIWVNCACTILAYGDSPANPTFGWSNGVLSVSVPGSTGLTARFRISSYSATITPNI